MSALVGSARERCLYVGYSAALFSREFLPRVCRAPVDFIDWPEEVRSRSTQSVKAEVFARARSQTYSSVVIALDHDPFFYFDELTALSSLVPTVGLFGDDTNMPQYASLVASTCWMALTTDPLEVGRYESIGTTAGLHAFDIHPGRYQDLGLVRDVDVLIYGKATKGRRPRIQWLREQLNDLVVLDLSSQRVPFGELLKALNRSKLTVNWSEVWQEPLVNNFRDPLFRTYRQFKGRVLEAALTGCVPVTGPFAAQELVFGHALPTFHNNGELETLIRELLSDDDARLELANLIGEEARAYLARLPDSLDLTRPPIALSNRLAPKLVDEVTATYRLLGWLQAWRRMDFSAQLSDFRSIRWRQVRWRFVGREVLRTLGLRITD